MRSLSPRLLAPFACLLVLLVLSCHAGRGVARPLTYETPAPAQETTTGHPPVMLTAADGTSLILSELHARAVLEEPLALTELQLAFDNPLYSQTEGQFEILLPPGARVTRFAMHGRDGWHEAEVVGKQEARQAYETMLLEDRDPAILERDTGNRFRGRVFPIEPQQRKLLRITYVQTLPDPQQPYRLALRDLPWLQRLDASVTIIDPLGRRPPYEVERQEYHQAPRSDLVVARDAPPHDGVRQGERILARVQPLLGVDPGEPSAIRRLTVLVDTSASRALDFDEGLQALGRVMKALTHHAGTAHLQVLAFDQEVVPIYEGPLLGFGASGLATLHARRPLGASDLGRALRALEGGEHQRVLLVSDGLVSAGELSEAALRRQLAALSGSGVERLDALVLGSVRDEAHLRRLVSGPLPRSGVIVDPLATTPERVAERLATPTFDGLRVEVPGARWWSPTRLDGMQPGDAIMLYTELHESQPLRVQVSGPVHHEVDVPLRDSTSALVAHEWRQGQIEGLVTRMAALQDALESERLRRHVVELSVRHRIFNDFTSFLVLDTEEDYARFGLDRRALAEILVVGEHGVEVVDRTIPDESEPQPESESEPEPETDEPELETEQPVATGAISGVVTHQATKERLSNALLILQCTCLTGGSRETSTNAQGLYAFRNLPPGTYTIQVLYGQADVSKVTTLPARAKFRANFSIDPDQEFKRMIRVESRPLAQRVSSSRSRRRARRQDRAAEEDRDDLAAGHVLYDFEPSPPPPPSGTTKPTFGLPSALEPPADEPEPTEAVLESESEPESEPIPETTTGRVISMEEFRNIPVSSSSSRDFTSVVDVAPAASPEPAEIPLAGASGGEHRIVVQAPIMMPAPMGPLGPPRHVDPTVHVRGLRLDDAGSRRRVHRAIRKQLDPIEHCYFRALSDGRHSDYGMKGHVRVVLQTNATGRVISAQKLSQKRLWNDSLMRCLESTLLEWRLPASRSPVTFTLVFRPNGGPPDDSSLEPLEEEEEPDRPTTPAELFVEIQSAIVKDPSRALSLAVARRERDPVDVLALIALGEAARARGDLRRAARAYGSILDLYPSRADMRRFAAANLEALDDPDALALAVDAYQHALTDRPDHPSGHRNLAHALLRQGRAEDAFEVLEHALRQPFHPRFSGVHRVLADDLGIVAAVWRRLQPTRTGSIRERLAAIGVPMATEPTLRITATWEADANDVDLHVEAGTRGTAYSQDPTIEGGGLVADVNAGFGPEHVIVPLAPDAFPCRITVHYYDRGPMGHGLGKVQILHHDGEGLVRLVDHPFVALEDDAWLHVDTLTLEGLQTLPEPTPPSP
ncbi:VIT domain-containing protein [Paraliomyxa miuraensis]|uniref:VIT domain-containing protein n=1 Tax=Paraliomyxa miuraensis TaxID=376150 RepID=UPI00225C375F|nr:VIT domain-containing protein [Paraliomyxa miuraensis]MCX4242718.1 VIT domain-containing protein [Paraliomyxa miuraensis]